MDKLDARGLSFGETHRTKEKEEGLPGRMLVLPSHGPVRFS